MTAVRSGRSRGHVIDVLMTALLVGLAACAARAPHTAQTEFDRRVQEYLELRTLAVRAAGAVTVTDDGAELSRQVEALAARIQGLRLGLPQGTLFTWATEREIRAALSRRLDSADGRTLRQAIEEIQPMSPTPEINQRYPASQPRSSMPTAVLAILPALPPVLEYRFVGRGLLLLDRNTAVVVDVAREALPR